MNSIRHSVNLVYRVAAATDPHCKIWRDPLRRQYPDVNYGVYIECSTAEALRQVQEALTDALARRELKADFSSIRKNYDNVSVGVYVWPYPYTS